MLSRPTPARPTILSLESRIRPASTFVLPLTINASYWLMIPASFVLSIPGWLSTVKPASERILTPSSSIGSEISTLKAHIQPLETVADVFASGGLNFSHNPLAPNFYRGLAGARGGRRQRPGHPKFLTCQ